MVRDRRPGDVGCDRHGGGQAQGPRTPGPSGPRRPGTGRAGAGPGGCARAIGEATARACRVPARSAHEGAHLLIARGPVLLGGKTESANRNMPAHNQKEAAGKPAPHKRSRDTAPHPRPDWATCPTRRPPYWAGGSPQRHPAHSPHDFRPWASVAGRSCRHARAPGRFGEPRRRACAAGSRW